MAATSHSEFNDQAEGLKVAQAFASSIHGKTIIITGVNRAGIGFTTAEAFVSIPTILRPHTFLPPSQASQSPSHLILAGRNPSKLQECIPALSAQYRTINYRSLHINLSNQQSVRAAAAEVLSWSDIPTLDILINSAGIMLLPERTLTPEGIEMHFATNHIGHFLFTCLIMPKLTVASSQNAKGATRIINVTSLSPTFATMRWSDMTFDQRSKDLPESERPNYDVHRAWGTMDVENMSYIPLEGYNQSKVANVLFSIGMNKKLYEKYGILSLAVHPGVIQTELGRNMEEETAKAVEGMVKVGLVRFRGLGAGAATSLVAALDPWLAGVRVGGHEG